MSSFRLVHNKQKETALLPSLNLFFFTSCTHDEVRKKAFSFHIIFCSTESQRKIWFSGTSPIGLSRFAKVYCAFANIPPGLSPLPNILLAKILLAKFRQSKRSFTLSSPYIHNVYIYIYIGSFSKEILFFYYSLLHFLKHRCLVLLYSY